ncbi:MAG: aminotransferase class III-fold pyridoxal phosphate-dependent enzyme [Salinivirgaceae bacterium]|nr:aminotransferase class III-fold pyridoxal phosphate-dependent enzyme [Salinivirgaceae bacterium]
MQKSNRQLFFEHVAQTTTEPLSIEIERAEGIYMYGPEGQKYIDLVSGVSVSNVGHCHPQVVQAVQQQAAKYMHLMVYGEMIQAPQVQYAGLLAEQLDPSLNSVYFVNSGSEAVEGALKLAKRATGRSTIVAFQNAYHGGTHGALSILGNESLKNAFRPLLPGITHLPFNDFHSLKQIDSTTACVIVEPIQAEAGIILPEDGFLSALRKRCDEVGALLIFDEIQTGFGRIGELFAHQKYNVVPDIMTIAKGMGGGMPLGAFVAQNQLMSLLTHNPALGHITTFGGHPVSCAAAKAALEVTLFEKLVDNARHRGMQFAHLLEHHRIRSVRGSGLFLAVELDNINIPEFMGFAARNGVVFDPFLFNSTAFRIAPPLVITEQEVNLVAAKILDLLDGFVAENG